VEYQGFISFPGGAIFAAEMICVEKVSPRGQIG